MHPDFIAYLELKRVNGFLGDQSSKLSCACHEVNLAERWVVVFYDIIDGCFNFVQNAGIFVFGKSDANVSCENRDPDLGTYI